MCTELFQTRKPEKKGGLFSLTGYRRETLK